MAYPTIRPNPHRYKARAPNDGQQPIRVIASDDLTNTALRRVAPFGLELLERRAFARQFGRALCEESSYRRRC